MNSIRVKATVNLPGLSAGEETLADGDEPYVKRMIEASFLEIVYPRAVFPPPQESPVGYGVEPEQADDSSNLGDAVSFADNSPSTADE